MTDDDTIRTLLLESIDAELGERREVPRVDERALATRSARPRRRAVGLLPLAAAAAVAAIVTGTVAVVDQASSGPVRPATTHSSHAPTPPAPTPTPTGPESSRRSAASTQAAVRAAASRAAASRSSVAAARSAARAASASAASAAAASSAAASAAAASASAAAQAALLDRFRGPWLGHDRTLSVAASGIATEMLTAGCCSPQLHVTFRLTDVRGTVNRPVATATVTSVRPDPGFTYDPGETRPYVGESATISIVGGVLGEPFTGTQYCARGVNQCGA